MAPLQPDVEQTPFALWKAAGGGTPAYDRKAYFDAMVKAGHLVPAPRSGLPVVPPKRARRV